MDCDLTKGMRILADSQSAMKLAANESINRRNKHIDITFHYVREVTSNGEVTLGYVPTADMVADMLNKPLGRIKFEKLRSMCGITGMVRVGNDDERKRTGVVRESQA